MRVVIAGGGVAALEAAAALHSLAAGAVGLTLLAPNREFSLRALTLFGAFGIEAPPPIRLREVANHIGARVIGDRLAWVDRATRTVHCAAGHALPFDALLLATGATARGRYPQALTLDDDAGDDLRRLTADVAAGRVRRLALVAPERMAWPLPLYEVALLTAALAAEHDRELGLTLVTAEATPLAIFGERAGAEMRALLDERGIDIVTSTRCRVTARGRVVLSGREGPAATELIVDRVIALPELIGPHVRGLPAAPYGFIPIDRFCRVPRTTRIYAAGDGTDYPVKHGAIAAQQADVAARGIAAAAGAGVRPRPLHPRLEGVLLTGDHPRHLTAWLAGGRPFASDVRVATAGTPDLATKVAAPHLVALLSEMS